MNRRRLPHFTIKNRFQKREERYSDILNDEILRDVCRRITGSKKYACEFDDEGYNIGRMAILEYRGMKAYISFSETEAKGRNSSFQSVASALARYILDNRRKKRICFYFLASEGNRETDYFVFMYRLMMTAGIEFLNDQEFLSQQIQPFNTIADVIASRNANRGRNRSNNPTYVTRSPERVTQIFGKTYGASKYETTLLCVALSRLTSSRMELYEINEQTLSILPELSRQAIDSLGTVKLIPTDLRMERLDFENKNSLRSPLYTYNLLARLGAKKCALCDCEIPELIQGAHIWPVLEIKKDATISIDEKLRFATDGNNGLWLCENHHGLLDANLITIDENGHVDSQEGLEESYRDYIEWCTPNTLLTSSILTAAFVSYLRRRIAIN
jgi:hypothetical protein